jgi:hypothetical protein
VRHALLTLALLLGLLAGAVHVPAMARPAGPVAVAADCHGAAPEAPAREDSPPCCPDGCDGHCLAPAAAPAAAVLALPRDKGLAPLRPAPQARLAGAGPQGRDHPPRLFA